MYNSCTGHGNQYCHIATEMIFPMGKRSVLFNMETESHIQDAEV